jgi:DNA-binding protein HU-beta
LKSVDLPTLGRPTRTTEGGECGGKSGSVDRLSASFYSSYRICLVGNPPMIKVDIVNEVSKIADITKVKAEVAVDAVFDAMRLSMQRGDRIELRGFGVFQVKPRKRGIGRNPRTGKEVRIPPGRTIRFKPGKDLQNIG